MVGDRLAKLVKMMVNVDVDQIHVCFGCGLLLPVTHITTYNVPHTACLVSSNPRTIDIVRI